jgi:Flp pilus assembly pilin Flp
MRTLRPRSRATDQRAGLIRRFIRDTDGQDIVEYAFLAAFIGITGYLALNGITSAVGSTYSIWLNPAVGVPSLWDPAAPLTSGT